MPPDLKETGRARSVFSFGLATMPLGTMSRVHVGTAHTKCVLSNAFRTREYTYRHMAGGDQPMYGSRKLFGRAKDEDRRRKKHSLSHIDKHL